MSSSQALAASAFLDREPLLPLVRKTGGQPVGPINGLLRVLQKPLGAAEIDRLSESLGYSALDFSSRSPE